MKLINTFILAAASTMTANSFAISTTVTQVNLDTLCRKFPLNSRCEDYQPTKSELKPQTYQLDRNSFCEDFSFNSRCQKPPTEVIKLNLDRSGEDDEWVLIEKQDRKIKLLHTTQVKDGLVSGALNGALGFVPFPLPFIEANKYDWQDHRVIEVAFKSDRCQTKNCTVTGKDTLTLPKDSSIHQGWFTIEYQEKNLRRSLSFRIPPDIKAESIDTITVEAHQ